MNLLIAFLQVLVLLSTFTTKSVQSFVVKTSSTSRSSLSSGTSTGVSLLSATGKSADELPPVPAEWQGQVLKQLKKVIDPDLNSDIVSLGFVKDLRLILDDDDDNDSNNNNDGRRTVAFSVELTTPACPVKDQFAAQCQELVEALDWTDKVQVTMTAQPSSTNTDNVSGMSQVGAIVAVSSCKGGVGKSTTAVNLAFSLQQLGATVGILDADVYGPSLPTMVTPDDDIVRFVGRQIAPLQRNGVRLMSFGYVNEGSAVMRGPMVTQLLDQFLAVTHWGPLDYLILDMPPGTGDIQLTLTQRLNISAAVIVTTPQELSFADVVRGVEMFDSVQVPSVAVVENMAYYQAEKPNIDQEALTQAIAEKLQQEGVEQNGGSIKLAEELVQIVLDKAQPTKEPIFGAGHKERLSKQWGIEHTFSVPLMQRIAANGDNGTPFVLENPDSPQAAIYRDLAKAVVSEVAKAKFAKSTRPVIEYKQEDHVMVIDETDKMTPAELRRACRCAACVEELTGRQILIASQVPESIKPINMGPTGNYALSVDWSDGHRSLYPYKQIRSLLQSKREKEVAVAV